jgi:hypothetical protein
LEWFIRALANISPITD